MLEQTFQDWELVVVDDGSPESLIPIVAAAAAGDRRIRCARLPSNQGIVGASNQALGRARGTFVALMDHDDLLDGRALARCVAALSEEPDCDLLYTDEDWIDMEGRSLGPFLKPDWSPERLRGQNYVNHLCVYRRTLVEEVGGFRTGFDGSQDYDLLLRASERARRIVHLPETLYHWRVRPGQVSGSGNPAVYRAARRAIEEHGQRIGVPGVVEQVDPLGVYRVRRSRSADPLVSIVIPTRGSSGTVWGTERVFVVEAVRSIVERSTYANVELVVVADTCMPPPTEAALRAIAGERIRLVGYDRPFNYAHKVNLGVLASRGPLVLLLNDDVEVISPDWIETMLGLIEYPDVGMVGCALLFEDGTFQHAGHLYLGGGAIGHIGYATDGDSPGPISAFLLERECSGVTAACALLRRSDYLAVGGLTRRLPMNFNDVDLSLKIRAAGHRIVWTPFARLYHFESRTRQVGVGLSELQAVQARWGRVLDRGDPYWRYPDVSWTVADPSPALREAALLDEAGVLA